MAFRGRLLSSTPAWGLLGLCLGVALQSTLPSFAGECLVNRTDTTGIEFGPGFSCDERRRLARDLSFLAGWSIDPSAEGASELKELLGLPEVSASALQAWLTERVSLIVGDKGSGGGLETRDDGPFAPPGTVSVPAFYFSTYIEVATVLPNDGGTIQTLAENVSAGAYSAGKKRGFRYSVRSRGKEWRVLDSPRRGVIRLNPSFFGSPRSESVSLDSPGAVAFRLSGLFHEARHSDGYGSSLMFEHATCPKGHPYAGGRSCDLSVNGPYRVSSLVLKALRIGCSGCDSDELELLTRTEAGFEGRILRDAAALPADYREKLQSALDMHSLSMGELGLGEYGNSPSGLSGDDLIAWWRQQGLAQERRNQEPWYLEASAFVQAQQAWLDGTAPLPSWPDAPEHLPAELP